MLWLWAFETIILILVWCFNESLWWRWHLWSGYTHTVVSQLLHNQIFMLRAFTPVFVCHFCSFRTPILYCLWNLPDSVERIANCFCKKFHSLKKSRKRSLSDCQHEDLDNTRDSVLSDQSHFSATETETNTDPELMIIDFEYCAYNYRGFDLANHFIEWMLDYSNKEFPFFFHKKEQYPNKEQQVWLVLNLGLNFFMRTNLIHVMFIIRSDSSNPIWWK